MNVGDNDDNDDGNGKECEVAPVQQDEGAIQALGDASSAAESMQLEDEATSQQQHYPVDSASRADNNTAAAADAD
jgi:hypothetical protein